MLTAGIVLGVILVIALLMISIFNNFAKNRNIVKDAFSNIDVILKKRTDLIPNLVNTVKGYAKHESGTLEKVIQARNQAVNVSADDINARIEAENKLTQTLRSIMMLTESYPDLKADGMFLQLQQQLQTIETELEKSRKYYNATVRENNTYGETFPAAMFASFLKYQEFKYFEIEAADRENVKVEF